jgi:hypothetical protein
MRNNYSIPTETYNFSGQFRTVGSTYPIFQAYGITKRERDRFLALRYHSPGEITLNLNRGITSTSNNTHLTTYNILRGIRLNVEDHQGIIQNAPLARDLPTRINFNGDIVRNNIILPSNEVHPISHQNQTEFTRSAQSTATITVTEPMQTENSSVQAEDLLIDFNFEETVQETTIFDETNRHIFDGLTSNVDEDIEIAGEFEVNPNLLEAWHVTHNS